MSIDPNEIRLSSEQQQLIAERATRSGKPWQAILQDALCDALMPRSETASSPANGNAQPAQEQAKAQPPPGFDEDTEYLALCMEELCEIEAEFGSESLTGDDARRILSKVPGSMIEDIDEDRGDR